MTTIREAIERIEADDIGLSKDEVFSQILENIVPIEYSYIKRIEELEEKARAYDLLMEMPEGVWLQKSDSKYYAGINPNIKKIPGQTPQEALINVNEKMQEEKSKTVQFYFD